MKFSATFAILAVFASKAVVLADPMAAYQYNALEARAEFLESALEHVLERFYDDLLDDIDARDDDVDLFDARDFDDEEDLAMRASRMAGDIASQMAGNAPKWAQGHQQSRQMQVRQKAPRMALVAQQALAAQRKKQTPSGSGPRVENSPSGSKWNVIKKPGVLAAVKEKLGKKRSLEDIEEDLVIRASKKIAGDIASQLADKAPGWAQGHQQSREMQARQKAPRMALVAQQALAAQRKKSAPSGSGPRVENSPSGSKWNKLKKPGVLEAVKEKLGKK